MNPFIKFLLKSVNAFLYLNILLLRIGFILNMIMVMALDYSFHSKSAEVLEFMAKNPKLTFSWRDVAIDLIVVSVSIYVYKNFELQEKPKDNLKQFLWKGFHLIILSILFRIHFMMITGA